MDVKYLKNTKSNMTSEQIKSILEQEINNGITKYLVRHIPIDNDNRDRVVIMVESIVNNILDKISQNESNRCGKVYKINRLLKDVKMVKKF